LGGSTCSSSSSSNLGIIDIDIDVTRLDGTQSEPEEGAGSQGSPGISRDPKIALRYAPGIKQGWSSLFHKAPLEVIIISEQFETHGESFQEPSKVSHSVDHECRSSVDQEGIYPGDIDGYWRVNWLMALSRHLSAVKWLLETMQHLRGETIKR